MRLRFSLFAAPLLALLIATPLASAGIKCTLDDAGGLDVVVQGAQAAAGETSTAVIKPKGDEIRVIRFDETRGKSRLIPCGGIPTIEQTPRITVTLHNADAFIAAALRLNVSPGQPSPVIRILSREGFNVVFLNGTPEVDRFRFGGSGNSIYADFGSSARPSTEPDLAVIGRPLGFLQVDGFGGDDRIGADDPQAPVRGTEFIAEGGPGDDRLLSGGGATVLAGGPGDDVLVGGRGSDVLVGGGGNNKMVEGAGRDEIDTGPGRGMVNAGPGADSVDAEDDNPSPDRIDCGPGQDSVDNDSGDRLRRCEQTGSPPRRFIRW